MAGNKISRIEIGFPVPVDLPPGWERALDGLIDIVCKQYEAEHPGRIMWPSGRGAKTLWREPEEPEYDDSVYEVTVAEREASEREKQRRKNA